MSSESHPHINEVNKENNKSVVTHSHYEEHVKSTGNSALAVVNDVHQLQTEIQAQYQHDKRELTELNQRFRLFINRVQLLESENLKYSTQIAELRQKFSFSNLDTQWSENYFNVQSGLIAVSDTKMDFEFEFELFQLQIEIFRKMIDVEQQWLGGSHSKLEAELKQSVSVLETLRAAYAELEREIAGLHTSREDIFKQYLQVTHDWCSIKNKRKKWALRMQILKSQIVCFKNLRAYSIRELEVLKTETTETKQFWTFELDKCIKKIRRDFEILYAAMYHQMTSYYETKVEELHIEIEEAVHYQKLEMEEIAANQKRLQIECEEVQKSLSRENEIRIQLEATCAKLEAERESNQLHYEEQYEAQSKTINSGHETIIEIACDIEELRRTTKYLEGEIIVYRHLLESSQIQEQVTIVRPPQFIVNETVERFVVESESTRKGSVGIKECATSGKYISLMNHSMLKEIDISKWVLKRRIDSAAPVQYIIPAGLRLQPNQELIIYSKLGASESVSVSSLIQQKIVYDELATWGMGNTAETVLYNQNGEERASLGQTVVFR